MWSTASKNTNSKSRLAVKAPHEMIEEYHRQQLHPGAKVTALTEEGIVPNIKEKSTWATLKQHHASKSTTPDSITFSVWEWCNEVLINGMTSAYFGKKIFEINPNLLKANTAWERSSWKYMFKFPSVLAKDMNSTKGGIVETLRQYFDTPQKDRSDALYFVNAVEDELRACDLDNGEIARINMLHHWRNIYKVTFWTIAYLIHNPQLLAAIREEVRPALIGDDIDLKYLTDKCPRLEALFNEILRVNLASALAREVVAPTVVGEKVLHKGTKIIVPYRQLHLAPDILGQNAYDFDLERFLRDKTLVHHPSYRPFGGGNTLCPGHYVARRVVFTVVALLFSRFDVSLDGEQQFPRIDDRKPGLGALPPVEGDNAVLVLREIA